MRNHSIVACLGEQLLLLGLNWHSYLHLHQPVTLTQTGRIDSKHRSDTRAKADQKSRMPWSLTATVQEAMEQSLMEKDTKAKKLA